MKDRREKMLEYEYNYGNIPKNYIDRLNYICDKYKIDSDTMDKILQARENYINTTYYQNIRMVLYEIPEYTPRPRARLVSKKDMLNSIGQNSFIQVYSISAHDNYEYLNLFKQEHLPWLNYLLNTPCDIEYRTYFPTPKTYNVTQIVLAEIGLDRPLIKPDFDNIEKSYSDAFTGNIWIDDIIVVDATFRKYYSILPRVEIDLKYSNQLYNKQQYQKFIKRKDYDPNSNLKYFKG